VGHDTIHTLDLPYASRTTDAEINELSVRDRQAVIIKHADLSMKTEARDEHQ